MNPSPDLPITDTPALDYSSTPVMSVWFESKLWSSLPALNLYNNENYSSSGNISRGAFLESTPIFESSSWSIVKFLREKCLRAAAIEISEGYLPYDLPPKADYVWLALLSSPSYYAIASSPPRVAIKPEVGISSSAIGSKGACKSTWSWCSPSFENSWCSGSEGIWMSTFLFKFSAWEAAKFELKGFLISSFD